MNNPAAAFIKIMEIELNDLEDDIQMLMAESEVRKSHEEISNYVHMENLALLQKEVFGVDGVLSRLKKLDPGDFGSPEEVSALLLGDLQNMVDRNLIPPVLFSLVERKFAKVNRYLCQ